MIFTRIRASIVAVLVVSATAPVAKGQLVLTNFGAAHPIKIMAVGDSITDDCSQNGAWRLYLQPMLETNGFPFTFVGRIQSTAASGFTKVRHEGYCGSVIAAPGVLDYAVHGYDGTNVYLQKILADALNANTPDLILILMGANDIGRGRNPYWVATNDIPNLLSMIFAKVPGAIVILNKALTLQDGSILGYGAYATNVPVYNAALQKLVNQRQAAGQKVFLADTFSAVDYSTMFVSDHVHPNSLGFVAIAREWLARIQSITQRTNQVTRKVIMGGAAWKYLDNGQEPATNWAQLDYDDSSWSKGPARLGYGDGTIATPVSFGPDPTNKYVASYFRGQFVIPWNLIVTNLNFRLARADGAAVWLNGQELFRTNLPSGPITFTNLTLRTMTGFTSQVFYPTNLAPPNLLTGTNIVGIEIHKGSVTNGLFGFDMELIVAGTNLPSPALSFALTETNLVLSWPVVNGSGYSIYSTTNLSSTSDWHPLTNSLQTNGGQILAPIAADGAAGFFRLQRPQ